MMSTRDRDANGRVGMHRTGAVLLALLAVAGCSSQPSGATAASTRTTSPQSGTPSQSASTPAAEATVVAYYTAIAAHDPLTARTRLAPEYYKLYPTPAAYQAWIANYLSLTKLTIDSERPVAAETAAQHPGYTDLHELLVSYDAVLRTPSANETTGPMERFVIVGRRGPASPWLILDIATGP